MTSNQQQPGSFEHDDPRHAAELAALETFVIEVEEGDDGRVVVTPVGDLDMLTAPPLRQQVGDLLAERASLVIDLSRITFVDSAGLRALLLAGDAGEVEFRDPSAIVRQTFEIAKMAAVLTGCSPTGDAAADA